MTRERWMAMGFAIGSTCFLVGPLPGYDQLLGNRLDAATFFIGSLFFTAAGAVQTLIAEEGCHSAVSSRAALWSATIQSAGTLFFNFSTFRALETMLSSPDYTRLVWRPDAFGSICFLVSGAIAYTVSSRRGWLPVRSGPAWWTPLINLLGCVFFGISAIAGYVLPSTGSMIDEAAANWNTSVGAACFLACAIAALRSTHFVKAT